jgi:hypothetical protein
MVKTLSILSFSSIIIINDYFQSSYMKRIVVASIIVAILIVVYVADGYHSSPPGPLGSTPPEAKSNGFRVWVGKTFKDRNGQYVGVKRIPGQKSQPDCYNACNSEDCGSATWNPRNGGECYHWRPEADNLQPGAPDDQAWSRAYA